MRYVDIVIQITDLCNLRCRMCEGPREGKIGFLDFEAIKRLIDNSQHFAKSIALTGGEPLLHPKIYEIISYASSKGYEVYVPSNGTLISYEIARKLKDSGVNTVNVSIEGPKEINDSLRGEGNFDKAIKGLENLRKLEIESTIAMTIMKVNFKYMGFIMELAKKYRVSTVKYQPFNIDFVIDKSVAQSFYVREEDIPSLKKEIEYAIFLSKESKIQTNPDSYLRKIPEYFLKKGKIKVSTCNIPFITASIDKDGEVYPCWPMKRYGKIGNIKEEDFNSIWKSKKFSKARDMARVGNCPGCLMSCHDKNFSSFTGIKLSLYKDRIVKQLSSIKRKVRWKFIKNSPQNKVEIKNSEFSDILNEIKDVKKKLDEKINSLKN